MAESKQIEIDGVLGTWTPIKDDGWEYLGEITEFEEGYEYQFVENGHWCNSFNQHQGAKPSPIEYRRRPLQVWQGAGFYIVQGCTDPIPVIKRDRRTLPYISGNHAFANLEIVRLVRKFTDEEIHAIVNEGVWPEEV